MSNNKIKVLITGKLPKIITEHSKLRFTNLAEALDKNFTVFYPTQFSEPEVDWNSSIRSDISRLMMCKELHLLPCWQGHKRSEILRNIAMSVGIRCIYA